MKNNQFRCSCCNEVKSTKTMVMIPWARSRKHYELKRSGTDTTQMVGVCKKCASLQDPNETGRALIRRMEYIQMLQAVL